MSSRLLRKALHGYEIALDLRKSRRRAPNMLLDLAVRTKPKPIKEVVVVVVVKEFIVVGCWCYRSIFLSSICVGFSIPKYSVCQAHMSFC